MRANSGGCGCRSLMPEHLKCVCEDGEMGTEDDSTAAWQSPSASRRFIAPDGRTYVLPSGPDPTARNVRQLLARPGVPVAVFDRGEVEWLEGDARQAAWTTRIEAKLDAVGWPPDSYHATRWRAADRTQMLMFEHSC
jgi:hypothetical protein